MMKVVNITLHAINNYGSVLQTLATERIFQDLGCEVETIDYIRETARLDTIPKILTAPNLSLKGKIKTLAYHLFIDQKERNDKFVDFRNKYLHLSNRQYLSDLELEQDCPQADIYCTGSDQTWNVVCQGDIPKAFFLDFAPKEKPKISFAASFGIESIPKESVEDVRQLLSEYNSISVREQKGVEIINKLGLDAKLVLDPTLAVNPNLWDEIVAPPLYNEDYILAYQLNRNSIFTRYMKDLSSYYRIKLIQVRSHKETKIENGECLTNISPEEWLSLVKYAKYIITDSFHCTAYCILFHRYFVNIMPARFSSRIVNILENTGLMNRIVKDFNDFSICDQPIDFKPIDKWLEGERENTLNFLRKAITS